MSWSGRNGHVTDRQFGGTTELWLVERGEPVGVGRLVSTGGPSRGHTRHPPGTGSLDREATVSEFLANAVLVVTLEFDGAVVDGAAAGERRLQFRGEVVQVHVTRVEPVEDGDRLAVAAFVDVDADLLGLLCDILTDAQVVREAAGRAYVCHCSHVHCQTLKSLLPRDGPNAGVDEHPVASERVRPIAFDFDGTLSDSEMVVRLAAAAGVADRVAAVTERAMNGEVSYAESLRERVGLLEGLSVADAEDVLAGVRLRPGAGAVLAEVRAPTAILTGGFERGVRTALDAAGVTVDRVVANRVDDDGDRLTGVVDGPLIDETKDTALREWCASMGVDTGRAVAVGDGANDVPMLREAGLAVGFDPSPAVEPHCDVVVDDIEGLASVFTERDLAE